MPCVKGDRVGAISCAKDGVVEFLGFGVYEGEHIPKEAVGFLAEACKEAKRKNPRIRLDNGKVVYGCECWWGSEKSVKKQLKQYKQIKEIDVDDYRKSVT